MFEIKDLLKKVQTKRGEKKLLSVKHLFFEEGKLHTIRGNNGSGKTTLLHILALVASPSQGSVYFCNEKIDYTSDKQLYDLRRQIVLMEQSPIMFTGTVAKNISFGLEMRKVEKKIQERKIDEVLEKCDLTHLKSAQAKSLSGGETQRVALARALVLEPKCFILDEPTASLDTASRSLIENILKNMLPHTSIIMTTHSEEQNTLLSQNTIYLDRGELVNI